MAMGRKDEGHTMTEARGITIDPSYEGLARARAFVRRRSTEAGAPGTVAARLALAADEICTNVIDHGRPTGPIELFLEFDRGGFRLTITDDAAAFDPRSISPVDVGRGADRPVGGLGWHLVVASVDTVDYRREDGRNVVTVTIAGQG